MLVGIEDDFCPREGARDVWRWGSVEKRQPQQLGALDPFQSVVSELPEGDEDRIGRVVGYRKVDRGFKDHEGQKFQPGAGPTSIDGFADIDRVPGGEYRTSGNDRIDS